MATCKDCLHYQICGYVMDMSDEEIEAPNAENDCQHFKSSSVEVVHGRWETANDGTHFCPHCGCDAPYTWDDIDRNFIDSADDVPDRPSNYCPHCGAKMDGGKEK